MAHIGATAHTYDGEKMARILHMSYEEARRWRQGDVSRKIAPPSCSITRDRDEVDDG
jgi:hypothetical protein